MKKQITQCVAMLMVALAACVGEPAFKPEFPAGEVEGYEPVYSPYDNPAIVFTSPRTVEDPGKIYIAGKYLLVNERYLGVHVFDNSDPKNPKALGFLQMPGNTEVTLRNGVLYADHLADLVALDVSDWSAIRELSRVKQTHWLYNTPPPNEGRYFECPDPNKVVIGWRLAHLTNPKCFR